MTAQRPLFHVVGEPTPLRDAVARLLGPQAEVGSAADATRSTARIVVSLHGLAQAHSALEIQAAVRGRDAFFLPVGIDADVARIGPALYPGRAGCLRCLLRWSSNEWTSHSPAKPHDNPVPGIAWSRTAVDCIGMQIAEEARAMAHGPALEDGTTTRVRVLRADLREWRAHKMAPFPGCECAPLPGDAPEAVEVPAGPGVVFGEPSFRGGSGIEAGRRCDAIFVDRRFGLIKQPVADTSSHLHPVTFAPFELEDWPGRFEIGVGRTGRRSADAGIAVLEALERFCGFRPRGRRTTVRACHEDLGAAAIDPERFVLHQPRQFDEPGYALGRYRERLVQNWVWGYSLRRGEPVLVPEQVAYYQLPRDGTDDRYVFESSNGCAIGGSLEEAALFGLFEVVERDAFLCSWYGGIPGRSVDLGGIRDRQVQALHARLEGAGLEVRICDIRVGLSLPTIAAFAIDRRPSPQTAMVCAAGAHPDPTRAVTGAMLEICTMLVERHDAQAQALRARSEKLLSGESPVAALSDHLDQCRGAGIHDRAGFMFGGEERLSLDECGAPMAPSYDRTDLGSTLLQVAGEVLEVADDVVIVDQSFDSLRRAGLRCVKVLAPGLLPMTFGHQYRRISAGRVARARATRGLDPSRAWPCHPHPFP